MFLLRQGITRQQLPGLDDEFLAEIDAATARIIRDPLQFEQVRPGIRRA